MLTNGANGACTDEDRGVELPVGTSKTGSTAMVMLVLMHVNQRISSREYIQKRPLDKPKRAIESSVENVAVFTVT